MAAHEIPVGARIVVPLSLYKHHGIYLGNGQVAHNSKKHKRVCIETLEKFSDGRKIHVSPPSAPVDSSKLTMEVRKLVGKSYSLLSFNCEHFLNQAMTGKPSSRQVAATLGGAGIGFVIASKSGLGLGKSLALMGALGLGGLILANSSAPRP